MKPSRFISNQSLLRSIRGTLPRNSPISRRRIKYASGHASKSRRNQCFTLERYIRVAHSSVTCAKSSQNVDRARARLMAAKERPFSAKQHQWTLNGRQTIVSRSRNRRAPTYVHCSSNRRRCNRNFSLEYTDKRGQGFTLR